MNANDKQVGGNHYKSAEDNGLPQHWDIVVGMGWSYLIGNATKYLWRLDKKGGPDKAIQDLEKAIHYLEKELSVRKAKMSSTSSPKTKQYVLSDVIRERITDEGMNFKSKNFTVGSQDDWYGEGLEDSGDANSRYTNQG